MELLREARAAKGLSLQAAAGAANISTGYLHKLEAGGVNTPSPRVLQRLAGVLDVPYWTLMERAGYVEPKEPAVSATPAPTNAEIVRLLQAIREELARLAERQEELARKL